jgi:hypothetical protein
MKFLLLVQASQNILDAQGVLPLSSNTTKA